MDILILGASYGSLFATKCLMAGHNVHLVCTPNTATLINNSGTEVFIRPRGDDVHRCIRSGDQPGNLLAFAPGGVFPKAYDLIVLAMQEPQYAMPDVKKLMRLVADSGKPVLSIMNHPPLPYLKRIHHLAHVDLSNCYTDVSVWDGFDPALVSLCSPDPQAFRPADRLKNILHVGLPTNFKAASFSNRDHSNLLRELERDIEQVRLNGKEVPVKLRVFDSLFVPLAKWSMLCAGNYRCVQEDSVRSIKEAVHGDLGNAAMLFSWVVEVTQRLGAELIDTVPFHKYAHAADNLTNPSSIARAIHGGSLEVERVDKLVQQIALSLDMQNDDLDEIVRIVDARLYENKSLIPV